MAKVGGREELDRSTVWLGLGSSPRDSLYTLFKRPHPFPAAEIAFYLFLAFDSMTSATPVTTGTPLPNHFIPFTGFIGIRYSQGISCGLVILIRVNLYVASQFILGWKEPHLSRKRSTHHPHR
jgi:hypothetical protein